MTKLQVKAFVFQLLCFAVLFILFRILLEKYSNLTGFWVPITSFVVSTILSPKFQAVKTNDQAVKKIDQAVKQSIKL